MKNAQLINTCTWQWDQQEPSWNHTLACAKQWETWGWDFILFLVSCTIRYIYWFLWFECIILTCINACYHLQLSCPRTYFEFSFVRHHWRSCSFQLVCIKITKTLFGYMVTGAKQDPLHLCGLFCILYHVQSMCSWTIHKIFFCLCLDPAAVSYLVLSKINYKKEKPFTLSPLP